MLVMAGSCRILYLNMVSSLELELFQAWFTDSTFQFLLVEIMQEPLPICPQSQISLKEICARTARHPIPHYLCKVLNDETSSLPGSNGLSHAYTHVSKSVYTHLLLSTHMYICWYTWMYYTYPYIHVQANAQIYVLRYSRTSNLLMT